MKPHDTQQRSQANNTIGDYVGIPGVVGTLFSVECYNSSDRTPEYISLMPVT